MSLPTLQKHYLRIQRLWPVDHLRPISFQDSFRKRLENRFLKPVTQPTQNVEVVNAAQVAPVEAKIDETKEREQLNALYSLLENRYSRQYPCSEQLFRPASRPTYYDELAREMEVAPNRTWFQRKWLRLSQIVRFS